MSQKEFEDILRKEFEPLKLEVVDQHYLGLKHEEDAQGWHFTVKIVSTKFEGLTRIARHKLVYKVIQDYIDSGVVHAVGLKLLTPEEDK